MGGTLTTVWDRRMHGSCCECCSVTCCPPLPSHIAIKLALMPPKPAYTLTKTDNSDVCKFLFLKRSNFHNHDFMDRLEFRLVKTGIGQEEVAILFIRTQPEHSHRPTILYSHGNAKDIGELCNELIAFGNLLKCNVCTYDYPTYGASTGKATPSSLDTSIDVVYNTLLRTYKISGYNIILYGESIGSVPTMDLASRENCGGVILVAPLLSGARLICSAERPGYCCDVFDSSRKIEDISAPILVIHGTCDEIIDHSHGKEIHKRSNNKVAPLFIEGANHNGCVGYSEYMSRLKHFINVELNHHD